MTDYSIKITQEAIDWAKPRDSRHCMIAYSIEEMVPDATNVSVDLQTIRFSRKGLQKRYIYLTPRKAQVALVKFDRGEWFEPFTLRLRQPQIVPIGRSQKIALQKQAEKVQNDTNISDEEKAKRVAVLEKKIAESTKRHLTKPSDGAVPSVRGGRTPPTQITNDGVPFTRRRAFGLRGLDM